MEMKNIFSNIILECIFLQCCEYLRCTIFALSRYKIYVVNHKWQADLLVFVVHHNYEAKDKDELWHL
ncbi:MAG: hypothetical protein H6609_17085 [Ignavibacteriales bacterium]|nr:hypothetical protein [Ignavibacteriales bacterium]